MNSQPHITLFAVQSLDGYIGYPGQSTIDWRSNVDARSFTAFLDRLGKKGVIVVGHNTYKLVQKRLSKRNCIVLTRSVGTTQRKGKKLLLWNPNNIPFSKVIGEYRRIALLGGSETYGYFLEYGLIDEIRLTIEPVVFGSGLRLFDCQVGMIKDFHLTSFKAKQETVFLRYRRLTRAHI
ncbi:MAG TPA: dihydrofolate reductase family protein [Candidatus Paceibacterota bacterium]